MPRARDLDVVAVVALGGALGSLARYALALGLPHRDPAAFAWATFLTNVSGCLLIGVLMWFVLEVWGPRRYARPFLGIGVLGGFTTFSTYAVETQGMARAGAWGTATAYVAASVVLGLLAVRVGYALGRQVTRGRL
ncbi:MAG TPA: CrcB family protein [Actinomycetes bacterium]|nr:CrcB family protein [Actinomycetes bacterium]